MLFALSRGVISVRCIKPVGVVIILISVGGFFPVLFGPLFLELYLQIQVHRQDETVLVEGSFTIVITYVLLLYAIRRYLFGNLEIIRRLANSFSRNFVPASSQRGRCPSLISKRRRKPL